MSFGEGLGGIGLLVERRHEYLGCSDFTGTLGERWCLDWKFGFIKNNIVGKVYFETLGIKASVATLIGIIAEKEARLASEG
jgi:hypothetical protein